MKNSMQTIVVLAGFMIPLLVGVLSKLEAPAALKAILNFGLSALSGLLGTLTQDFVLADFLLAWGTTWAISVASYYGLWKPTGTAEVVQVKTASVGLGKAA